MGKRIVITGAGSDIGMAICRKLDTADNHLILHYLSREKQCSDLQAGLKGQSRVSKADFTNLEELTAFCKTLGNVDILINTAAVTGMGVLPSLSEKSVTDMINVNVLALIKLCQTVIPGMTARRYGRIINLSSVAASRGVRGQSVYAGTKGFVESFSRSLAAEYGSKGVRVNCVAPGPINAGSLKELMAYAPEEVKASLSVNALGTPEDVANAVAFLAADSSGFINGRCIDVDGGYMRGV